MSFNFNAAHKILSSIKLDWQTIKTLPSDIGKFLRFHRHYIKYDNMPPGSKLIYNIPFSHFFIYAYIFVVPPGALFLASQVVTFNKRLFSLTQDDLKISKFSKKPHEYYIFFVSVVGIIVIIAKFAHEWPLRIYRQNNQYTGVFINKLNPFRTVKIDFEEVTRAKTWKLSPWHENRYVLCNKKPVGIFDHHVEPPIEYFTMLTPRNLRKQSSSS